MSVVLRGVQGQRTEPPYCYKLLLPPVSSSGAREPRCMAKTENIQEDLMLCKLNLTTETVQGQPDVFDMARIT